MKRTISFLIILILICSNAFALTWSEALSAADQNNNELKSVRKQLEASEWTYRRAFSEVLPQLSISAGMTETLSTTSSATSKRYSYGINITQNLFKGGALISGVQSAYADLEYQKALYKDAQASAYYDLWAAYIDLLLAQKDMKLAEEILKQRDENSGMIQLRYESGKEDKGNLLTTKAELVSAKNDLSSAKRGLNLAKLRLSQMLAQDIDMADEVKDIEIPEEVIISDLVDKVPSLIMQKKQLEKAEIAQRSSYSGFLPTISLSGSRRMTGPEWHPDSESKSWSLNVSYSLFPGGSNIADLIIAGVELDQAKEDFQNKVNDVRYELEDNYYDFVGSVEDLNHANIALEADKERSKVSNAKYLNGLVGYDEWYRIENSYIQARRNLLNSQRSAYLAKATWHKTYGGWIK